MPPPPLDKASALTVNPKDLSPFQSIMTRSHKANDRDHAAHQGNDDHLPRFFAKHGHVDSEPGKVKKNGGGNFNWGREGDELDDFAYNMSNPRRRSNSNTLHNMRDIKTKFETVEPEPVFEEEIHGPLAEDNDLDKVSTGDSTNTEGSVEEDEQGAAKKH
ncbi:hypothetical protein JOL62DRAFT_569217 [Phyllosticta paracitricarpa]|uniref:Uncharacterized protein n=2 Tax=Phyllosticta TaxID=121621 RepID=A0ABR1NCU0_9PEZI